MDRRWQGLSKTVQIEGESLHPHCHIENPLPMSRGNGVTYVLGALLFAPDSL